MRGPPWLRAGGIALALAAFAACNALTGVGDLETAGDGGADAYGGDGAVVLPDAARDGTVAPDGAASDGGRGDAGPGDAAGDAPRDGGALDATPPMDSPATQPYCRALSPAPTFCDDFDVGVFGALWNGGVQQTNGTASASSAFALSPPHAYLAAIPSVPGGQNATVMLSETLGRAITGPTTYAFSVYIEQYDSSALYPKLAAVRLPSSHALYLQLGHIDGPEIVEQYPVDAGGVNYANYPLRIAVTTQQWVRVQLSTAPAAGSAGGIGTFTVTINGATVLGPKALVSPAAAEVPTIELGAFALVGITAPWQVYFDNVTFDMQ